MRITRLLLRNYRVYEDEVELEVPAGLVGVYGPNGAGKSYLIEAIPWTLFGVSRTSKDDVRTSGINAECVTELEFEHEGHLYLVRRTIAGQNHLVKAEAWADRAQVAEGVRDTNAYVQSILGMDVAAFKSSVFAEQKQIASFSNEAPAKRRDLVLRLLGIMPLDIARDNAKRDARHARESHDHARKTLPDLVVLQDAADRAAQAATEAEPVRAAAVVGDAAAKAELVTAEEAFVALDGVRQQHERLVAEGKSVAADRSRAAAQIEALQTELAGLASAQRERSSLVPLAARYETVAQQLADLRRVADAETERAKLAPLPAVPPAAPDEPAAAAAQSDATEHAERVAALQGQIAALEIEHKRAAASVARTAELNAEAECPLCGQPLGEAFETVRTHREHDLGEIEASLGALNAQREAARRSANDAKQRAADAARHLAAARKAFQAFETLQALHRSASQRVDELRQLVDTPDDLDAALVTLGAQVTESRAAQQSVALLDGRLQRRAAAEQALAEQQALHAESSARREALLAEVRSLGFEPGRLDEARARRDHAREAAARAATALQQAEIATATAAARSEAATQALVAGQRQHAQLDELADDARHTARLADLLGTFRNAVVSTVGPTLAAHAADLFAELTDREYDQLEVDPDTYEIRITDAGRTYGMGRFSGSETDLANLALRVAISENVRLQSGGAVGLLVLDEVFGPLDDERRDRMLYALERLKARFRQVLVVTHANDVKEQLPNAIEVVKRPGRRATARILVSS